MSAVAKMHHTEKVSIKIGHRMAEVVYLPQEAADNLVLFIKKCQPNLENNDDFIKIEEIEPKMRDSKLKIASILRGARHKEGLNQLELAKKLNITQSDLSKMENAKRPIGKNMAQRIAAILKVDYRIFL